MIMSMFVYIDEDTKKQAAQECARAAKKRHIEKEEELFLIRQAIAEEEKTGVYNQYAIEVLNKEKREKQAPDFKEINLKKLDDLTQQVLLTRYICNSFLKGKIIFTGSLDLTYMKASCNYIYYHTIDNKTGKINANGVNYEGLDDMLLHQEAWDFWQECYLQVLSYIQYVVEYNKQLKQDIKDGKIKDDEIKTPLEYSLKACKEFCKTGLNHYLKLYMNRGGHGSAITKKQIKQEKEQENKGGTKVNYSNIDHKYTTDITPVDEEGGAQDILKHANIYNCTMNCYDGMFFSDKQVTTIIRAGLEGIKKQYPEIYKYTKLYLQLHTLQAVSDITGEANLNKINTYIERGKKLLKLFIQNNLL